MSKWSNATVSQRGEKISLPCEADGTTYGTPQEAGLKIVSYIGSTPTKDPGLYRNSFLVAATNGVDGTAFLAFNTRNEWSQSGFLSLAFDMPEAATQEEVEKARGDLYLAAAEKARANNTPDDKLKEECEKIYKNLLTQIRMSIGANLFQLQDWKGVDRDPEADMSTLIGTRFSGVVVPGLQGQSEIKAVLKRKAAPAASAADKPPF